MTQHTPGPWHVADWRDAGHAFPVVAASNGHGLAILMMNGPKGKANARLIAAAPAMLEALREIARVSPNAIARTPKQACEWARDVAKRALGWNTAFYCQDPENCNGSCRRDIACDH